MAQNKKNTKQKSDETNFKPIPKKLVFNGNEYKRVTFDDFTFRQNTAARGIMQKIVAIVGEFDTNDFELSDTAAAAKLYELNLENEVLALYYINQNESVFRDSTFDERKEVFKDLPIKKYRKYEGIFENFLTGLETSFQGGILTYMNKKANKDEDEGEET